MSRKLAGPIIDSLVRPSAARRGVRQQVAGQVLADQPVVRHVVVEGADQVVAVAPGERDVGIALAAVRLAVAEQVHPVARPALAEVGRFEIAVDQVGIGRRRVVSRETGDLGRRRGQPAQVERQAADERGAVRVRRRREPGLVEGGQDEPVDRRRRPGLVIDGGRLRRLHRLPGPVRAPALRQIERRGRDPAGPPRRRPGSPPATALPSRPSGSTPLSRPSASGPVRRHQHRPAVQTAAPAGSRRGDPARSPVPSRRPPAVRPGCRAADRRTACRPASRGTRGSSRPAGGGWWFRRTPSAPASGERLPGGRLRLRRDGSARGRTRTTPDTASASRRTVTAALTSRA